MKKRNLFATTSLIALGSILFPSCSKTPNEVVYGRNELSRALGAENCWTPTAEEVANAKRALRSIVADASFPIKPKVRKRLADYALSFSGVVRSGKKVILIRGDTFWKTTGKPLGPTDVIADGGDSYFDFVYVPEANRITSLASLEKLLKTVDAGSSRYVSNRFRLS